MSAAARQRRHYCLLRAFVGLLGLGAIVWGGVLLPLFWEQAPLGRVSLEIVRGRTFKIQSLDDAVRAAAARRPAFCVPTERHDEVVVRLAMVNNALAKTDRMLVRSLYDPLYDATRAALACSPADPFAWLTLYWLDTAKRGPTAENEQYLRLSYATGPNEGWLGSWRFRLAIATFDQLPPDLASDAVAEFVRMVEAGWLPSEAAKIFVDAPPTAQQRIVSQLALAKPATRQNFGRTLYDLGLNFDIPGFERPTRPWR
jgi:hypothetical protein